MIKKAKDYLNSFNVEDFKTDNLADAIKRVIQQAQIDMLEYTINKCIDNVTLSLWDYIASDGFKEYYVEINRDSILNTIEEIKEELKED